MNLYTHKIHISEVVINKIKLYISRYRDYHEELFVDSGIWSEEKIIQEYIKESENRYLEIRNILKEKLSNSVISYQNNTTIIRWRSKILLVSFIDDEGTRIITDLEIR